MKRLALRKSFLSILPFVVSCLICYFFIYFSDAYSKKIAGLISNEIGSQVSIQRAQFSPTSGVRIRDVVFTDPSGQTVFFGDMALQHSFQDLLKGRLLFKKILVDDVVVEIRQGGPAPVLTRWVELLGEQTKKEKRLFGIDFRETRICFHDIQIGIRTQRAPEVRQSILLEFCLDSEANRVKCNGKLDYKNSTFFHEIRSLNIFERRFFDFNFEYESLGSDLVVDQIKIQNGQFVVAGSGLIKDFSGESPRIDLSVHSDPVRIDRLAAFRQFNPQGGEIAMIGRVAGTLTDARLLSEWIMPTLEMTLEKDLLHIGQFFCQTDFSFKNQTVSISECRGVVDGNLKFLATGKITRLFDPIVKLRMQLMQVPSAQRASEETSLVIAFQGERTNGIFGGKTDFHYGTVNGREYSCIIKDLKFLKNELTGNRRQMILRGQGIRIIEKLAKESAKEKEESVIQNFDFDHMDLALGFIGKRTYIDNMTVAGYTGTIAVKGDFYMSPELKECLLTIAASNINLENVRLSYPIVCELSGFLSGTVDIASKKETIVRGALSAQRFKLTKLEPLNQVADFIGIDSIKDIEDAQVAVEFELLPASSVIKRLDIDSSELGLRSNYTINEKNWFEGEIALSLPRSILEQSKIFKTLMSIARERNDLLDFVVHLSGYPWQLRTELVKSDLRDKLKERVSAGIQKHIEREANKAIVPAGN